jgi:hypothetical protein
MLANYLIEQENERDRKIKQDCVIRSKELRVERELMLGVWRKVGVLCHAHYIMKS